MLSNCIAKLNLEKDYIPLYERLNWNCKLHIPLIDLAVDIFDCGNSFKGKNFHEKGPFFHSTTLNIFQNYISNRTVLPNDKDPSWFNNEIRKMLTKKNEILKQYIANGKPQTNYQRFQLISNSLTVTIRSSKEKFF